MKLYKVAGNYLDRYTNTETAVKIGRFAITMPCRCNGVSLNQFRVTVFDNDKIIGVKFTFLVQMTDRNDVSDKSSCEYSFEAFNGTSETRCTGL